MPSFPALEKPLTDGFVSLRLYAERDIPEILIAYQDDRHLPEDLGEERAPSGAQLGRQAEQAEAQRCAGTWLGLTILEGDDDVCRGRIIVRDVDWARASAELDVWVAPQARGRGLAEAALSLASEWLVDACGLERLELRRTARARG